MSYPKLTTLLGLSVLSSHSNLLGKSHFRFTEEQCNMIEAGLTAESSADQSAELSALQTKFDALQENYNNVNASNGALTTALKNAVELNGLTSETETATPEEAITLLGAKCKEYGASENRHSFANNNGITAPENGLINNVVDMNDAHNKINL